MKNKSMKGIYETAESIIIALVVIVVLILFFFRAVSVDGDSMLPGLRDGERLIVSNLFYTPEKGDIIVTDKNISYGKPLVKRVIATEGDKVFIDYSTGDVYVNDTLLSENYIAEKILPKDTPDLEVTVTEGYVFVMGDNRNNSSDSRNESIGLINTKNILGKALFRIYPLSEIGAVK